MKGSLEKRSKSIFEFFELVPLSCRGVAKLYPQKNPMYKYSESIAIEHFNIILLHCYEKVIRNY